MAKKILSSHLSRLEFAREVSQEPDKSDLVALEGSMKIAGYTGGGTQIREAGER